MRIRTTAVSVTLALALVACGGGEEATTEADTGGTDDGATEEPATDEAADGTAEGAGDDAADDEEEFDASVSEDRLITAITFAGDDYDIRDITCDDFGHMWRLTGYIDTVHAGGDRIMITDHEDREGAEIQLNILDQESETEVIWGADQIPDLDLTTGTDGGAAGTAELELLDQNVGPRDDEAVTFDLACEDAH